MKNFFKYLQVNQDFNYEDLIVLNAGYTKVLPGSKYPATTKHPSGYYLNFQQGRIISEYQLIYISEGSGIFESKRIGKVVINPGTIIFIFPGEWHRYKPDNNTGWTESWIGFYGTASLLKKSSNLISPNNPIVEVGYQSILINTFKTIFDLIRSDFIGVEYTISGAANYLLGLVLTQKKRNSLKIDSKTDELILKAKALLEENFDTNITMEEIARKLNLSYIWFRIYFKRHTGFSPYEYLLNIKIYNAKVLLQTTIYSVKQIADLSGFNSQYQFSRMFKQKTGKSPKEYKNQKEKEPEN